MADAEQTATYAVQVEHLPVWWRCVLVAVATLILCSCSSPALRTHLSADRSLLEPPQPPARVDRQPPALPGVSGSANVIGTPNGIEPPAKPGADCVCDGGAADSMGGGSIPLDPYGPLVGPSDEYLCDGGDYGTPAGVKADHTEVGVEPEDAISHYDAADGRILVTPSNRVCIYAPRFAAVRRVVEAASHEQPVFVNVTMEQTAPMWAAKTLPPMAAKQRHAVAIDEGQRPANLFRQRQQAGGLENLQASMDAYTSLAPYANLQIIRTGEVSQAEKARVERAMEAAVKLTGVQAAQVVFGAKIAQAEVGVRQPGIVYQTSGPEHPRLRLCKLASTGNALPGEEVEFTLRYDNIGDQTIDDATIVDNLTTRFQYVPGSAKSSVDAEFDTKTNDAGSLILRWELKHPVKPGEGGILRFKVLVR